MFRRAFIRFSAAACLSLAIRRSTYAQAPLQPEPADQRGEAVTLEPVYQGVTANAPIPASQHLRNEGGIDGAGLCVYTSNTIDGVYQQVPELRDGKESALWKYVKGRPGGSYPAKFEADLKSKDVNFQTPWFQFEGTSDEGLNLIQKYNAQGLPVAVTMNTGRLYKYRPIHHMVSLIHLDDQWACVVDNNDPGRYHWMPRAEFSRRWMDGPKGWFVVILHGRRKALIPSVGVDPAKLASAAMLFGAAGLAGAGLKRRHENA